MGKIWFLKMKLELLCSIILEIYLLKTVGLGFLFVSGSGLSD